MNRSKRRYSGLDKHFGPFTISTHHDANWSPLGIVLDSGGDHEYSGTKGCHLKFYALSKTLIVELPNFIPDFRIRHYPSNWDDATVARMGRNWYDEIFPREYGFYISDDACHLYFGPQTHDNTTTRSKVLWLPWRRWRFLRQSWYGLNGEHLRTEWEKSRRNEWHTQYENQRVFKESMPKAEFEVRDYDSMIVKATTHIEEREWRLGTGLFRWLSWFVKPKVHRSLAIEFSHEVGPDKGSWKGGLMGTDIDMLPGELHEAAFRRFCMQEHRAKNGKFKLEFRRHNF